MQLERRGELAATSRVTCTRVPPSTSSSSSTTSPPSSQSSTSRSSGLGLAHDGAALLAVAPAEDPLAAGPGVELDLGREPLLEPLRVGQRLPDLIRLGGEDDLSLDVQLHGCVLYAQ